VLTDVVQGKVTPDAAAADYGVVLTGDAEDPVMDVDGTQRLRAKLAAERGSLSFFDRGPGFSTLAGGATAAEVDAL
jgi:N-methylhydantoinase B